ncbi:hypothetical protein GGX14DRAFT_409981, partial [Mycena pura]
MSDRPPPGLQDVVLWPLSGQPPPTMSGQLPPTMPPPEFTPPPYVFHGLELHQLPLVCQDFLRAHGLVQEGMYDSSDVYNVRQYLTSQLMALSGPVIEALVFTTMWYRFFTPQLPPGHAYLSRLVCHFSNTLLPAMVEHLHLFLRFADALVWAESEHSEQPLNLEEARLYRFNQTQPVFVMVCGYIADLYRWAVHMWMAGWRTRNGLLHQTAVAQPSAGAPAAPTSTLVPAPLPLNAPPPAPLTPPQSPNRPRTSGARSSPRSGRGPHRRASGSSRK